MKKKSIPDSCCTDSNCCLPSETKESPENANIVRRDFLKTLGLASTGLLLGFPSFGMNTYNQKYTIPIDKGLSEEWCKSLYERGEPEIYKGAQLAYIGMPIGGLFTGTVYLGGDGKLWLWDIFNKQKEGISDKIYQNWQGKKQVKPRDGANFIFPVSPEYPFEQGFGIKIIQDNTVWEKSLDFKGFDDISFKGQYPIAEINYRDAAIPVEIDLKSFSPFIPLNVENSSFPATIMKFTVTNTSNQSATIELSGWLENAVLNNSENNQEVQLQNIISKKDSNTILNCNSNTNSETIKNQQDFGNMSLLLMDSSNGVKGSADVKIEKSILFPHNNLDSALANHGEQLCGALSKTVTLKPKESQEITFIISWYFPNITLPNNNLKTAENKGRYYKKRFANAQEVGLHIANNFQELQQETTLWKTTFYDESTLPHWFLNRTFLNTSILATETCFMFEDGRFWAWEGIGCCAGTCTHVWHYAQALGRLFPEIEKNLREKTDFIVMNNETGSINFRGYLTKKYAADGQAGTILRAYRDYQISTNNDFLKRNWDNIKLALKCLINLDAEDGEANGTIFGEQHNTLDAEWYGNIPVITSLYLAALAAAIEMAKVMNDFEAENQYNSILQLGKKHIEKLFNGEYFIQNEDPKHKDAIGIGTGCYIDQVFGQSWAIQLGLGQVYNKEMIDSSLESLWKYNFVPDMGSLRDSLSPEVNGRPYALSGDAGLVMCTWPLGGKKDNWEKHWQFGYFNECMTGFEYQVASHMIWENKLDKGLSIIKAIHERYTPNKRNPYNEIECSDHYSRAMASYGAYISACGFTYNGPKGQLGFEPKLAPENFKAAFTSAQAWGTLNQKREKKKQLNTIEIVHGILSLEKITVKLPIHKTLKSINLKLNQKSLDFAIENSEDAIALVFKRMNLLKNDEITINVKLK